MAKRKEGVGTRLNEAIKSAGITQKALAAAIGTTQPAVSQWVLGIKNPTAENLSDIAAELGLNLEWLETGTGAMRSAPTVDTEAERAAYEAASGWRFRVAPADGGRDYGNANVWSFDPGLDVFVREVLQNAKDAAVGREPVRVRFRFVTLTGDDLEAYRAALKWAELEAHLVESAKGKQKFNTLLKDGLGRVEKGLVLLLVEDSGTIGLTGPEIGSGAFTALCRNNLDSNKGTDAGAGGAFGLGKAVLWRASRLSTVLFNSHLSVPQDGQTANRVFGRCELAWHEASGKPFAGPGWFGEVQTDGDGKESTVSLWGNGTLADALYLERDGVGTTACVLGFHDASDDTERTPSELAKQIVTHAAINFFPAMVAGKLAVTVEVYDSGASFRAGQAAFTQTVNPKDHLPAQVRMLEKFRDGETAEKLTDQPADVAEVEVTLTVPERKGEPKHSEQSHQAVLLVTPAAEEEGGEQKKRQFRLAVFRGPGMVVFDESLQAACLGAQPFHALLMCGKAAAEIAPDVPRQSATADGAAEQFLRVSEPPSHDKWTATPDLKALYARGCVTRLSEFIKDAKRKVAELVKPQPKDTGDGPDALKDLFRIGSEPVTRPDQPRVIPGECRVDEDGHWCVEARIRMKPKKAVQRLSPAVYFLAETGGGTPVRWHTLTGTKDCAADGQVLVVPAGVREVKFHGKTDPKDHPIPAADSCVVIDIKKAIELPEVTK